MIHKEIEVYIDDVIIKSRKSSEHLDDLRKFFERLWRYNLKLNPAQCAFRVPSGKLLGFIVSRKRIELDPSKIKAIQELPPPKSKKDVMSFLGRLNYISYFIAQSMEYLSNPPVSVPPEPGKPLLIYLSVLDNAFDFVLGQHDKTRRKEQAIYYLSKKFKPSEAKYTLIEHTCCALTWISQKLKHYMSAYTMHLISQLDPLKYIFQKPMLTEKLAKWKILLSEFDIVYITQKAIKGQALADYHAENLVDGDYESLTTYFLDEEVLFAGEDIAESYPGWRMFLDEAANFKGVRIEVVLISKFGQHYPASPNIRLPCTHNMDEYEACILRIRMAVEMNAKELLVTGDCDLLIHQVQGEWSTKNVKILLYPHCVKEICKKFTKIDFKHVPRIQNEFVDAFANLSSMIQHPDKNYTDLIEVEAGAFSHIHEQEVITFIWRNIICRFSLPKEISCDNGPQFTGRRTTEFFEKWYIKRILSTAYHPASNGQAESFNKTILNIMKKELEEVKGLWPEILPEVLWAHKTTPKMSTGDTPYSLIYGTETVIPIKVGEPSMR
nr:uncharacterized protein LOC117274344 [Nicotiana tomentosiformis]